MFLILLIKLLYSPPIIHCSLLLGNKSFKQFKCSFREHFITLIEINKEYIVHSMFFLFFKRGWLKKLAQAVILIYKLKILFYPKWTWTFLEKLIKRSNLSVEITRKLLFLYQQYKVFSLFWKCCINNYKQPIHPFTQAP